MAFSEESARAALFIDTATASHSPRSRSQAVQTLSCDYIGTMECLCINETALPMPTAAAQEDLPVITMLVSEIMREIADPANHLAYFVLPSQLNGAEYPSHTAVVASVEKYKGDDTGGPRGQLAAHPGAAQFVLDNARSTKQPDGICATDLMQRDIEAAGLLKNNFCLINGYLQVPELGSDAQYILAADEWRRSAHLLRVLLMREALATGLASDKRTLNLQHTHRVSLVYASAVPVNSYTNPFRSEPHANLVASVAHTTLVAQYYGALVRAAADARVTSDTVRVFLMPLGGGVFRNDVESIARAISEAIEMLTARQRLRLDIRFLAWEGCAESIKYRQLFADHNKLRKEKSHHGAQVGRIIPAH